MTEDILYVNEEDKDKISIITRFFLSKADTMRLTQRCDGRIGLIFTRPDEKWLKTIESLKIDLIKIERNNLLYNSIPQHKHYYNHYFYKLSKNFRKKLSDVGVYWDDYSDVNEFYGFEDPTFFKKGKVLGGIISHEGMVWFTLEKKALKELNQKGIEI